MIVSLREIRDHVCDPLLTVAFRVTVKAAFRALLISLSLWARAGVREAIMVPTTYIFRRGVGAMIVGKATCCVDAFYSNRHGRGLIYPAHVLRETRSRCVECFARSRSLVMPL